MASKTATTVRQRGSSQQAAKQQPPQQQSAQGGDDVELSLSDKLAFYTAQHIGLVLCALGVGLLALGYDKGLMHNTVLCLVSLGICLVGLFFHEFRPFNAQRIMEEEHKAASEAAR